MQIPRIIRSNSALVTRNGDCCKIGDKISTFGNVIPSSIAIALQCSDTISGHFEMGIIRATSTLWDSNSISVKTMELPEDWRILEPVFAVAPGKDKVCVMSSSISGTGNALKGGMVCTSIDSINCALLDVRLKKLIAVQEMTWIASNMLVVYGRPSHSSTILFQLAVIDAEYGVLPASELQPTYWSDVRSATLFKASYHREIENNKEMQVFYWMRCQEMKPIFTDTILLLKSR